MGVVYTFVDINASDEEEVVSRRAVLLPTTRLLGLTNVGADSVVTNLVWGGTRVQGLL